MIHAYINQILYSLIYTYMHACIESTREINQKQISPFFVRKFLHSPPIKKPVPPRRCKLRCTRTSSEVAQQHKGSTDLKSFEGSSKHIDGCFLEWWYPQIINFNRVYHYKASILFFSPYFWKHPYAWGCSWKLGSMFRINGVFHHISPTYKMRSEVDWGSYNPLILPFYQNFLEHQNITNTLELTPLRGPDAIVITTTSMTTLHFLGDRESQDPFKNMGIHTYHFFETNCGCVSMGVSRYTLGPCHWKPLAWKTLLKARNKSFRIPTFLAKWNFLGSHERRLLVIIFWKAACVSVTPYLVQLTFSLEACSWKNGDLVFQWLVFFLNCLMSPKKKWRMTEHYKHTILETCMGIDDPYVKKPRWRRKWNAISKMIKNGLAEGMVTRKLCVEVLDLVLTSFQTSFFSAPTVWKVQITDMLLLSTSFFSYPLPRSHRQGGFEKKMFPSTSYSFLFQIKAAAHMGVS